MLFGIADAFKSFVIRFLQNRAALLADLHFFVQNFVKHCSKWAVLAAFSGLLLCCSAIFNFATCKNKKLRYNREGLKQGGIILWYRN